MVNTILFDLDGTLLPMNMDKFFKLYFKGFSLKFQDKHDTDFMTKVILEGTGVIVANDGSQTNEDAFWKFFTQKMGIEKSEIEDDFNEFYDNGFTITKDATWANPLAKECVRILKSKGYNVVLATNPIFPAIATKHRMSWVGFKPEDFSLVTTYENSHFAKPNLSYYTEVLEKINKKPEECIMVGNDNQEDMCAEKLGIRSYLINDCLLNRNDAPIEGTWNGNWEDFIAWCEALPEI